MSEPVSPLKTPGPFRFVGAIFGCVFAGIGVTVIYSMWFGEMGEDAPTFIKMFASFIALAFVAMGGTLAIGSIFGGGMMGNTQAMIDQMQKLQSAHGAKESKPPVTTGPGNYICPSCAATITRADVSPLGDVKCTFCRSWFNIHGKR